MNELIFIALIVMVLLVLKFIFKISIKEIKKLGNNEELDELTAKLPDNITICEEILKIINNETVKIKESENEKSDTSLYIAITDTIIIAKIKESYTRVQTIAHECIHSIQDRALLLANFVISNIYLLYFISIIPLTIFGIIKNTNMQIFILLFIGFNHFAIRNILEIDAMIRAKYLAKQYLLNTEMYSANEINKIEIAYDNLNEKGIKTTEYFLMCNAMAKVVVYALMVVVLNILLLS